MKFMVSAKVIQHVTVTTSGASREQVAKEIKENLLKTYDIVEVTNVEEVVQQVTAFQSICLQIVAFTGRPYDEVEMRMRDFMEGQ